MSNPYEQSDISYVPGIGFVIERTKGEPGMNRKELLEKAAEIISGEREDTYGGPEDSFKTIAQYWTAHLSSRLKGALTAEDVPIMMAGLKLARLQTNASHTDSMVDCAGYMACLAEISSTMDMDVDLQMVAELDRR